MRLALALALAASGCGATFDAPPEVTIEGAAAGPLADPTTALVIDFSKKPVPSTIKLEIAPYKLDAEGNLPDEHDGGGQPAPFYAYDPVAGDNGGASALSADGMSMTISTTVALPIGPNLVLLVEPGLSDLAGTVTHARRGVQFAYKPSQVCTRPVGVFRSGAYFFLVHVSMPFPLQIQLFAQLTVDPLTGVVMAGSFTKAHRNPDPNRCPMPCDATHVCRLLPTPSCALASDPAGSVDEFSDYVPNPDPPTGFHFVVQGCATDQNAMTSTFITEKVDVQVAQPPVTLKQTQLSAAFTLDAANVLRGSGSLTAEHVLLGSADTGMGAGDLTGRSLTDKETPPGIPGP